MDVALAGRRRHPVGTGAEDEKRACEKGVAETDGGGGTGEMRCRDGYDVPTPGVPP